MIKGLIIGCAGLVGAYFGIRALALKRLNEEIQVESTVNVQSLTLTSLNLRIDILVKNPTGGTITLKYPYVKVFYGNTLLGNSDVKNKDFPLPAYSQMNMDPVNLSVSLVTLITSLPKLISDLQQNNPVVLQVTAVTTLNDTIPYTRTQNITINAGKNAGQKS